MHTVIYGVYIWFWPTLTLTLTKPYIPAVYAGTSVAN
jgi:hypothetical protein